MGPGQAKPSASGCSLRTHPGASGTTTGRAAAKDVTSDQAEGETNARPSTSAAFDARLRGGDGTCGACSCASRGEARSTQA